MSSDADNLAHAVKIEDKLKPLMSGKRPLWRDSGHRQHFDDEKYHDSGGRNPDILDHQAFTNQIEHISRSNFGHLTQPISPKR